MEIEEVAATMPESNKVSHRFTSRFSSIPRKTNCKRARCKGSQMLKLAAIFHRLYRAAMDYDAELMELNPLVETTEGTFVAADARLVIDDNALYRHPEYQGKLMEGESEFTPEEIEAIKSDLAYVKMDGNIGIIGNRAGLVMVTLDAIQLYGGKPANFLDVGGGVSSDRIAKALDTVSSKPERGRGLHQYSRGNNPVRPSRKGNIRGEATLKTRKTNGDPAGGNKRRRRKAYINGGGNLRPRKHGGSLL